MHLLPVVVCSLFTAVLAAQTPPGDELFTVSPSDGNLRVVDPLTATTVRSMPMLTTTSIAIASAYGLARHPQTGVLYTLVRTNGTARRLATVDPATGIVTLINATADNFANIAFRADGVLFAVTGDGASVPETLYTLDLLTANATLVAALGNGNDGESIVYDPIDGFLYHASGYGVQNVDEKWERLDSVTGATTNIPLVGHDYDEILGMTHWVGGNILAGDLNADLILINPLGRVTLVGAMDHDTKGLAFVPAPASNAFFRPYGVACVSATSQLPLLVGSGVPARGQPVSFEVRLAPASSAGMLVLGFGNGTIPFPSPQCQVQINPFTSASILFFTDGSGRSSLPAVIPPGITQADYWFQAGLIENNGLLVSNPLQVHVR